MKKIVILTIISAKGFVFEHQWNDWATHQPVLYEMALKTTGPIIEFGCGNSSTDLLHEICQKNQRLLVTIEDDAEWMSRFTTKYLGKGYEPDNSGWHKFFLVPGKPSTGIDKEAKHWIKFLDEFKILNIISFELCFVDQSPWRARTETIMRVKDKIPYIILHDCDYFARDILGICLRPQLFNSHALPLYDFSKTFKYYKVYFPIEPWPGLSGPPTLLGSNFFYDLPEIDYSFYNNDPEAENQQKLKRSNHKSEIRKK